MLMVFFLCSQRGWRAFGVWVSFFMLCSAFFYANGFFCYACSSFFYAPGFFFFANGFSFYAKGFFYAALWEEVTLGGPSAECNCQEGLVQNVIVGRL